tara:strand:+ start:22058 stop:22507 length:450 start_codon:yes stop_codon:yes gene_type:complete
MNEYSVIKAEVQHLKQLNGFVKNMCESADIVFPNLEPTKANRFINKMIEDGCVFCLVHNKKVVGSVAGGIVKWWFADKEYLSEMGFWIDKEHRNIETATMLLNAFKDVADKKMIPCLLNTLDGKDIKKRDDFFKDNGFRKIGFKYGYGL